jgi:ligand-binding sensor domain-containing protein
VWIGTREGALRQTPDSATWEHVLNGLASREITWLRADGDFMMAVSAGSESLYVSRNQGKQWMAEAGSGFEIAGAVRQEGILYIATRHHGLLAREVLATPSGGQH